MQSSPSPYEQPAASGSKTRLFVFTAVGILFVVAALVARYFLYKTVHDSYFETSPPPYQGRNAPYVKTPDVVVATMVKLADLSEDGLVYDLGCGDGRLVIAAVRQSGCRGVGFDIDPERVAEARENVRVQGLEDRIRIIEQDIFAVDLSQADAAIMYLLPWMMNKLIPQFEKMKPGCRIVAHDFWMDGVEPERFIELRVGNPKVDHGIYVYTTPLKKNPAMLKGKPPRPGELPSIPVDSR